MVSDNAIKHLDQRSMPEDLYETSKTLKDALHRLRDRLPTDRALLVGARLPFRLRGLYFEGWPDAGSVAIARHEADAAGEPTDEFDSIRHLLTEPADSDRHGSSLVSR